MVKQLEIEGIAINHINSFYEDINRVFMAGESCLIRPSRDAVDDLLFGGCGALQGAQSVELLWHNVSHSQQALGYQTTRACYLEKLRTGSPYNKKLFALKNGTGETYFDSILTTIADHPAIKVINQ